MSSGPHMLASRRPNRRTIGAWAREEPMRRSVGASRSRDRHVDSLDPHSGLGRTDATELRRERMSQSPCRSPLPARRGLGKNRCDGASARAEVATAMSIPSARTSAIWEEPMRRSLEREPKSRPPCRSPLPARRRSGRTDATGLRRGSSRRDREIDPSAFPKLPPASKDSVRFDRACLKIGKPNRVITFKTEKYNILHDHLRFQSQNWAQYAAHTAGCFFSLSDSDVHQSWSGAQPM